MGASAHPTRCFCHRNQSLWRRLELLDRGHRAERFFRPNQFPLQCLNEGQSQGYCGSAAGVFWEDGTTQPAAGAEKKCEHKSPPWLGILDTCTLRVLWMDR